MALLNRGRLSVQRAEQAAWDVIQKMADKGGWSARQTKKTKGQKKQTPGDEGGAEPSPKEPVKSKGNSRKRKRQQAEEDGGSVPTRRSTRTRTKV